ncbi:hypothetical protein B0H19DRAFT_1079947 [Mycena capillaripes]|nr:hypothetical protein B0H19DRAFT_1079947 [Mycena capillaripes]
MVYFSTLTAAETDFCLAQAAHASRAGQLLISQEILWFVDSSNGFELSASSLEVRRRLVHINTRTDLQQRVEAYVDAEEGNPPAYWLAGGDLRFEKLSARYSHHGLQVFDNVSFHIRTGERIGVGACLGHHPVLSLTTATQSGTDRFRKRTAYFDGIPTSKINVDDLRNNMTIIPQMTLVTEFQSDMTLIAIAHRLQTMINADKISRMHSGFSACHLVRHNTYMKRAFCFMPLLFPHFFVTPWLYYKHRPSM